ncbi:hypothetical protein BT93_D0890 [Corymbia citriodora subsp. variegata]|nr:hypothetical protein BT93_D0890 [Corymbia citriodora subsp. variegata]
MTFHSASQSDQTLDHGTGNLSSWRSLNTCTTIRLLKEDEPAASDMAYDDTRESLIENSVDASNLPKDKSNAVQRRRHCSNSPSVDNFPEQNGTEPHLLESTKEPTFIKILVVLAAYLGVGSFCFFLLRNQISGKKTNALLDALYFCVVTMTTVGYGDLVPSSTLAKLLASTYVFAGMALGGLILGEAADYILEKQQVLLVRAMRMNEMVGLAEILKEVEAHKIRYNFLSSLVHVMVLTVLGTVYMLVIEKFKFVDAFYCVCVLLLLWAMEIKVSRLPVAESLLCFGYWLVPFVWLGFFSTSLNCTQKAGKDRSRNGFSHEILRSQI